MQNKDQLFELHKYDLYLFICLLKKKPQYILSFYHRQEKNLSSAVCGLAFSNHHHRGVFKQTNKSFLATEWVQFQPGLRETKPSKATHKRLFTSDGAKASQSGKGGDTVSQRFLGEGGM